MTLKTKHKDNENDKIKQIKESVRARYPFTRSLQQQGLISALDYDMDGVVSGRDLKKFGKVIDIKQRSKYKQLLQQVAYYKLSQFDNNHDGILSQKQVAKWAQTMMPGKGQYLSKWLCSLNSNISIQELKQKLTAFPLIHY